MGVLTACKRRCCMAQIILDTLEISSMLTAKVWRYSMPGKTIPLMTARTARPVREA